MTTLVLDEIGEVPVNLQAVLLRALQEVEIQPVGAGCSKPGWPDASQGTLTQQLTLIPGTSGCSASPDLETELTAVQPRI